MDIENRENLRRLLEPIRLLILDVDGVLTDGRIILDGEGRECKIFDVKDGHRLAMMIGQGVEVIVITGRNSQAVEIRSRELGVAETYQGIRDKVKVYEEIIARKNLLRQEVAFVGDDLVDIPLLKRVGFAVAVSDASEQVKTVVHYVTGKPGGRGAVGEVCEMILKAKGKWEAMEKRYEFSRGDGRTF